MKTFKQYLKEDIFIGHKLKLQELQKFVRNWSDRIWSVNKQLKDHSNIGEFGQFCKDYPEYVTLYWYCGGRKLQPTKKECEDLIKKEYQISSIDALSTNEKWDLLNKGLRPSD